MDDTRIAQGRSPLMIEQTEYKRRLLYDGPTHRLTTDLIAALEASRAECARLRQLLEDRQRYIHCEIHVDEQHIPLGYWKDCQKPTCMDTAAALNGADDATAGE